MSVPLIPVSTGDASFRRTDQLIVIATMDTKDNSVMVTCTYYLWFSLDLFKIILNTNTQNVKLITRLAFREEGLTRISSRHSEIISRAFLKPMLKQLIYSVEYQPYSWSLSKFSLLFLKWKNFRNNFNMKLKKLNPFLHTYWNFVFLFTIIFFISCFSLSNGPLSFF